MLYLHARSAMILRPATGTDQRRYTDGPAGRVGVGWRTGWPNGGRDAGGAMMRSLPGSLDPGAPPLFDSPGDVIAWVRGVDWLLATTERAVLLHIDDDRRLTCVATSHSLLKHLGPMAMDGLITDALQCRAGAVLAVEIRPKLPPTAPSRIDLRRHQQLRRHFAVHGLALLDTVIVTPEGGVSVTGSATYPAGTEPCWLQVHTPAPRSGSGGGRSHEEASSFPPGGTRIADRGAALWLVRPPDQ
ncbi:MAG: hypothetical protein H0U53_06535 [Actinobacteria bacterium]|nr:hypothetical protein [Actinomycetota bacterium]